MGRISRGFDFLGYAFSTVGLTGIARKTVEGLVARAIRLYEQGSDVVRIGEYVRRWRSWVTGGLRQHVIAGDDVGVCEVANPPQRSPQYIPTS